MHGEEQALVCYSGLPTKTYPLEDLGLKSIYYHRRSGVPKWDIEEDIQFIDSGFLETDVDLVVHHIGPKDLSYSAVSTFISLVHRSKFSLNDYFTL
ncbi:hypothetical protein Ac2012v2_006951 [Leucoagaricus gongylophorus]